MYSLRSAISYVLLLPLSTIALAQVSIIPDTLEAYEITEANTLQKMRSCNPRVKQENLDSMLQRQAKNDSATLTTIFDGNERAAVVEKGGLWMCVQLSPQHYPVLPVDTLYSVVKAEGAAPERLKAFYRNIATALAETGFARALIPFETTGNAVVVFFAVSAESPALLAVDSRFLKKGEFDPAEYSLLLNDPNVRTYSVVSTGKGTQRDIFLGKHATRKIVDGFLIRQGNDLTRRFDFSGTTWKSPSALSTSYTFQKEGVVVYRSRGLTSFGSWKVNDGVLYFDINKYSYFSAILDQDAYLNAEARSSSLAGTANPTENRFKPRFFQEGNVAAEKEAREKLDNAFKAMQTVIEAKKAEILAESVEQEQGNDPLARKRQSLCTAELLAVMHTIATEKGEKLGDLCRSYLGTRVEWKNAILKDGCQGRCLPL